MRASIACEGLTEQLLDGTSPSWRASFSAKQNMVDVAQLVSASDCGSEGRGFDSHHPPHKRKAPHVGAFLLWNPVNEGSRRERPARRAGKKVSGGHFFSSGETPITPDKLPDLIQCQVRLFHLYGKKKLEFPRK